jgi:hypothetical protein
MTSTHLLLAAVIIGVALLAGIVLSLYARIWSANDLVLMPNLIQYRKETIMMQTIAVLGEVFYAAVAGEPYFSTRFYVSISLFFLVFLSSIPFFIRHSIIVSSIKGCMEDLSFDNVGRREAKRITREKFGPRLYRYTFLR